MKVSLKNLGPVKTASINISPLTIFVGPNNAGKSFTASIIYTSLAAARTTNPIWSPVRMRRLTRIIGEEPIMAAITYFADIPDDSTLADKPPEEAQEVVRALASSLLAEYLFEVIQELERIFGVSLQDLRRMSKKQHVPGTLKIESEEPRWQISLEFTIVPLRDEQVAMTGMVAMMRDVTIRFTELKVLRQRLAKLTERHAGTP